MRSPATVPQRRDERFTEFGVSGVFVFIKQILSVPPIGLVVRLPCHVRTRERSCREKRLLPDSDRFLEASQKPRQLGKIKIVMAIDGKARCRSGMVLQVWSAQWWPGRGLMSVVDVPDARGALHLSVCLAKRSYTLGPGLGRMSASYGARIRVAASKPKASLIRTPRQSMRHKRATGSAQFGPAPK
jgi:hypothetical protein